MKIVVVGAGGREHAIVEKLKQSPDCSEIIAIPGNGGIAADTPCVPIKATDLEQVVAYCVNHAVDYVVVAPDDPLAMGMVDALAEKGIPAFGPDKKAARIEASKVFSKQLMQKYGIPTADCRVFSDLDAALCYLEDRQRYPVVVKADGLALGKGVLICQTREEATAAVRSLMQEKLFGDAGNRVVVEEFLTGPEVSVLAFCDGKTLVPMVSSMDHKRALDGDRGKNTGGMGAIAPNPYYTEEVAQACMQEIFLPTLRAMQAEGAPFKGCLYFGLMLTPEGPQVIEYNCRFGDPETQVVLPLLESDLLAIMRACTDGSLTADMVRFSSDASACVVLASGGYPETYQTGYPIDGLETAGTLPGTAVYHAGTKRENDTVLTNGGRVLCACGRAPALAEAREKAYATAKAIRFRDMHYRRDIGRPLAAAGERG